jgi:parallel beta-helix repeat protein
LNTGYHGDVAIQAALNTDYITIAAAPGQLPRVNHLLLSGAARWRIQGLIVSAAFDTVGHSRDLLFINSEGWPGPSREITVENCSLYTVKDASAWTMAQWGNYAVTGARMHGRNSIFRNNFVSNVDIGIRVAADSCLIEKNVFENFSGCGMRCAGASSCNFIHNTVRGFHMVDNIFGIGFQGYSVGPTGTIGAGTSGNVSVIGNTIINTVTAGQPFKGQMYGIACFSGWYSNWTVENNVVLSNTWYGMAFYGAQNCRIINNSVCRLDTADCMVPGVIVSDFAVGSKSTTTTVRNNLCGTLVNEGDSSCRADHNIATCAPDSFFVDYQHGNLRLKPGCPAVDSGSADFAPATDIAGTVRPVGKGIDIGAYEYFDPTPTVQPRGDQVAAVTLRLITKYDPVNRYIDAYVGTSPSMSLPGETNRFTFGIYDIRGRQFGTAIASAGHSIRFMGPDASGVYIVAVKSGVTAISSRVIVR